VRRLGAIILMAMSVGQASAESVGASAQSAISRYREEHGLSVVRVDAKLMRLAEEQARAMAKAGVMEHDVYKPFAARVAGYDADLAVENIAAGTTSFVSTLELWKQSPGHNANLLRPGATRLGIAAANAPQSRYKVFWALILARPSPPHRPGRPTVAQQLGGAADEPMVRVGAQPSKSTSPGWLSDLSRKVHRLLGGAGKDAGAKAQ
jgi:hypothetical protein